MKMKFRLLAPKLILLLLALTPAVARAANQTVNNLGDTGMAGQLRAKIAACQSGTNPGGTITFASGLSGTITLDPTKGPLPTITTNVTINGGGTIEISGNHTAGDTGTRIFNVNASATLTLNNVTVSHGYSANGDGGAVSNFGTLNVNKGRFFSSETSASSSGSAILSWGPLNITGSEIAYNSGGGGAVKPRSSGALTSVTNCNFHHNTSTNSGGGRYGGAMQLHDAPYVTVTSSTFSNNSAGQEGGAVYVNSSSIFVADNIEVRPTHTKNAKSKGYNVVVDSFTGPVTALQ